MPTFGQRTGERTSGPQNEYFLKTFRDPQTKIRVLWDDPGFNFVEVKEHFDQANRMSYPCARDAEAGSDCVGCDYVVEHLDWTDAAIKNGEIQHPTENRPIKDKQERKKLDPGWGIRDLKSTWIFPAIDPKDYVSIYKIGFKLWEQFKSLYDLLGTITAQDIVILKSGTTFNDITYTPQAVGQPYAREPKVTVPTPETISGILGKNYLHALEKYGYDTTGFITGEPKPQAQAPNPAPVTSPSEGEQQVDPANPGPQARTHQGSHPDPVNEPEWKTLVPTELSVGELKDFLADEETGKTEFPARAPRSVLVGLANDKLDKLRGGKPPF